MPEPQNEQSMILRVCAAIVRGDRVLMVRHRHDGRTYWTLPGGGVEAGETPELAVRREVREETGLEARVVRPLFDESFGRGRCRCFLLQVEEAQVAALGSDPEEAHMAAEDRTLRELKWHQMDRMREDRQVSLVLRCLDRA